ncbi:hypothetical protein FCH28_31265 [Streptomyces piniterrae]|uniref:Uncharacterized protein n=1 Tax=Streptomyces piniterrae TaxID=2571125 RepID=A0A4U0N3B3_9ACTN|nr:DUF6332 family protein [Streptomyces piniterrae]TJZ44084.1 hypothetical protein FCH28_31265 [Streptomyces piniterrae]
MSPTRTQDERDTITVEIVFALVSAAFVGGIVFLGLGSPIVWAGMPWSWEGPWLAVSALLGLATFIVRLLWVLRWHRHPALLGHQPGLPGGQPSQPGRTSPDS